MEAVEQTSENQKKFNAILESMGLLPSFQPYVCVQEKVELGSVGGLPVVDLYTSRMDNVCDVVGRAFGTQEVKASDVIVSSQPPAAEKDDVPPSAVEKASAPSNAEILQRFIGAQGTMYVQPQPGMKFAQLDLVEFVKRKTRFRGDVVAFNNADDFCVSMRSSEIDLAFDAMHQMGKSATA